MKKNTAKAINRNVTTAVMNEPMRICDPLIVQMMALKLGSPNGIATIGMSTSLTSEPIRAVNAAPMMKPTAMSIKLPLVMKSRNSWTIEAPLCVSMTDLTG